MGRVTHTIRSLGQAAYESPVPFDVVDYTSLTGFCVKLLVLIETGRIIPVEFEIRSRSQGIPSRADSSLRSKDGNFALKTVPCEFL